MTLQHVLTNQNKQFRPRKRRANLTWIRTSFARKRRESLAWKRKSLSLQPTTTMHTSDCRTNYNMAQSLLSMSRTKRKQTPATHNAKFLPLHLKELEEDNKHSLLDSCLRLPLFLYFVT
jgi:hypothetical protein